MKNRSLPVVIILSLFTGGIYQIIWYVKTKIEMNKIGGQIPSAWLIIIPFVGIYWLWKYYAEGVRLFQSANYKGTMVFALSMGLAVAAVASTFVINPDGAIASNPVVLLNYLAGVGFTAYCTNVYNKFAQGSTPQQPQQPQQPPAQ